MKTLQRFKTVSLLVIITLMLMSCENLFAQTPQFYNYNNGTVNNSFPFNMSAGKLAQMVVPAGNFAQPTPATAGNITKFYVYIAPTYPLGPATYTDFKIMLKQSADSLVTAGAFVSGPFDTVYQRASVTLSAAGSTWLSFVLDHPFAYNPAQSLVIHIEQCGATGTTTGYSLTFSTAVGSRRTYSVGGCPYVYSGVSTNIINCGFDVSTALPCGSFAHTWTTGLAAYPPGTTNASRVIPAGVSINDTGYVHIFGGGTGTTTNSKYNIVTNTWSVGAVMPGGLATTTGVTVKDSIYVIGGYNGAVVTTNYRYNPRTDSWVTKAPIPTATMNADMVVVPWKDSLIICVGGDGGLFAAGQTTAVRVYNTYTDTWQNLTGTSLLPIANAKQGGAIIGDTIFTFGGFPNGVTSANSYRGIISNTNPITITWSAIAPLPTTIAPTYAGALYRVACATIKGVKKGVLLLGGANGTFYNGIAHLYNPCTNTYTALTGATGSAKNNLGATLPTFKDSIVYFIAGYNAAGVTTNLKITARCYDCVVTGISNNGGNIPETYSLKQNYPNPFNPVTKINYALPKSGFVTMKVYDMLGREVVNLVSENKAAGNYSIDFNASNLTSGVYFYRLEVNGFIDTKKMMLVK